MKGLLLKDLLNLSSYKTTLFVIVLFCGIAIVGTEAFSTASCVICVIVGMIALSTFNYDESSKSSKYILSLPVTKKEIVLSKYVFAVSSVLLGGLIGFLLSVLLVPVLNSFRSESKIVLDFSELFISTIGGMFAISLIQAIQIPCIYKYGAERGRVQMFVFIFLIVILITLIGALLNHFAVSISTQEVESFCNRYGILLLVLAMLVFYSISYFISYQIFQKKDN